QLTFRNILAMESGLEQSREMDAQDAKRGLSQFEVVMERGVSHEPFEKYIYNNAGYRLLFTAMERASGKSIPELTHEELFGPLSMDGAYWVDLVADGKHKGYQSIRMRPVDLLKVGQVMLDGGMWQGERYLSQSFINELAKAPAPKANPSYGLFWHLNSGDFFLSFYESDRIDGQLMPGTPDDAITNFGSRGQLITAIPSLGLTWVRTGPDIPTSLWQKDSYVARLSAAIVSSVTEKSASAENVEWLSYGGNEQGHKYSSLDQINRDNVSKLEVAWTHNHGDMVRGGHRMIGYETTPLAFEKKLYFTTPFGRVIAVDAETGKELWAFSPEYDVDKALFGWALNRGVSLRQDGDSAHLFVAPIDGRIYCVDARTGKAVKSFGENGVVDAFGSLKWDHMGLRGAYSYTMPPTLYENLVIVGSQIGDTPKITRPPGAILAFDAITGDLVWSFYTIPKEGTPEAKSWLEGSRELAGSANVWTKMSVDEERGLLYAPTSTPNSDFYGGHRPGDNLYAESLLCLDINTGKLKWHFQTVHHGIWDYDINSQPTLVDLTINGIEVPVVAQLSKTGFCYVFNRVTGMPIWPIEERAVPRSDTPGEWTSATQPFPTKPPALSQQGYSEADLAKLTPEHHARALEAFKRYRHGPLFTPPSREGTLTSPGYQGGSSWGGGAFDPNSGYLITNINNMAVVLGMREGGDDTEPRFMPRSNRFMDPETGVPFTKPPWGKLVAIDLSKGEIAWDVPLGFDPDVAKLGLDPKGTGAFNRGGPIVTAGGLVFMGGTEDGYFRAFDSSNGDLLFEHKLPFFAPTVPITYSVKGKQYVVISAGGHSRMHTEFDENTDAGIGDALIAFTLPEH
ncbi:MAG: PQQ-binding-like beta-propeller repeat protein, partial [Candidatus Hydrogenedentota bacterium]